MARKRDYAAEYARSKAKAKAEGYSSPHARSKARSQQRSAATGKPTQTPYQRRNARARAEGFDSYWQKRKVLSQRKALKDLLRAAFGDRPKYNQAGIDKWIPELDEDDFADVEDMTPDEARTIMAGSVADRPRALYYH